MKRTVWLSLLVACGSSNTQHTVSKAPPEAGPEKTETTKPAPTEPAAPTAAAPNAACAEQASKLASTLRDLTAAQPGFLPIVQGIKAPVSKGAKPADKRGVVIAITKDGKMFSQGSQLTDIPYAGEYLDDISRRAHEAVAMAGEPRENMSLPLYIWADRATPVKAIMALAAIADDPYKAQPKRKPAKGKKDDTLGTLDTPVDGDDPPPPEEEEDDAARSQAIKAAKDAGIIGGPNKRLPEFYVRLIVTSSDGVGAIDPAVGAKLPASEPESTKAVVNQLKASIGTCAPVITAIGTASLGGTPEKEAAKLIAEVPAGLTACQCKVANVEELTAGMRLWFGAWAPSLQWIELPKTLKATDKAPIGKYVK